MKTIQLTKGKVALVDDEDYEMLSEYNWTAKPQPRRNGGIATFYAQRRINNADTICMHQMILPGHRMIDHKDRDGLNNQRHNLRPCTYTQNGANSGMHRDNTTGYRGVFRNSNRRKPWRVQVKCNGRIHYAGSFYRIEDAALAYNLKASELFGEFAALNVIGGTR